METYEYYVIDVFTSERYNGNPLSVVVTTPNLSPETYEKIAREFGYSETSFIYYSTSDKALIVRSFTPAGFEIKGAGHNLLGAVHAAQLHGMEIFNEQEEDPFVIMKDEKIRISHDHFSPAFPGIGMLQQSAGFGDRIDAEIIAAALSLESIEISNDRLFPTVVKTEVAHLMVPLKNMEALTKMAARKPLLVQLADQFHFEGVYCFVMGKSEEEYIAQARFFNPGIGIDEDPATGSAAGPLAGYLFQGGYIKENTIYRILQGEHMNHPSVILFEVTTNGIWVGGDSIIVMEGSVYV